MKYFFYCPARYIFLLRSIHKELWKLIYSLLSFLKVKPKKRKRTKEKKKKKKFTKSHHILEKSTSKWIFFIQKHNIILIFRFWLILLFFWPKKSKIFNKYANKIYNYIYMIIYNCMIVIILKQILLVEFLKCIKIFYLY